MGWLEIVLLALIGLWLTGSLVWVFRRKKRGGCTGCCASCDRRCK
ncbi:MAG: FeoB-associated Cys-rich membrane protein [Faecousia sp.]